MDITAFQFSNPWRAATNGMCRELKDRLRVIRRIKMAGDQLRLFGRLHINSFGDGLLAIIHHSVASGRKPASPGRIFRIWYGSC